MFEVLELAAHESGAPDLSLLSAGSRFKPKFNATRGPAQPSFVIDKLWVDGVQQPNTGRQDNLGFSA
jgi:hypothetical protein